MIAGRSAPASTPLAHAGVFYFNRPLPTAPASVAGDHSGLPMATIAFKDGILVADSYASDDATVMQVVKCARLPKGDVAGGAGDLGQVAQALSWLAAGGTDDPPDIDQSGLLFTDGGVCYLASGKWPGVRVKGSSAIGSGAQGAMTAMRLGHSAEDAVRAVAGIDPNTGGEIDVLAYEPPKTKAKLATTGETTRKQAVKSPRKAR